MTENTDINIDELQTNFKKLVLSWVKLDDKIRSLNSELKDLKNEKSQFESHILDTMEKLNEDTVILTNGLLKKNVSQSKGALKEDTIQEAIQELTKDADKAYEMTQYIIQKRPVAEKISLKRNIKKIKKVKNI